MSKAAHILYIYTHTPIYIKLRKKVEERVGNRWRKGYGKKEYDAVKWVEIGSKPRGYRGHRASTVHVTNKKKW